MKKIAVLPLILLLALAVPAFADETFPGKDWKDRPNPFASPFAEVGGKMSVFLGPSPKSLNYYLENSSIAARVFGLMYETLLGMNGLTLQYEPGLAREWSLSDDKLTYTFKIDPKARWSDGKPVTAGDVKWTFDAIMNPKNLTGVHKLALDRFESPKVLDERTIQFTAKEAHWKNLLAISGFEILPRHAFEKKDFNKVNFTFPVVSGPYKMGEHKENLYLDMVRREDYWNRDAPSNRGVGNFETLRFRFYGDRGNAFEAFQKGEMDLFPVYTARLWVVDAEGSKFKNNWIVKQKVYNAHPVGFQGFAMNMRKPPFDDVRVRKAMACLVNREKMNKTIMYSQYYLLHSYFPDLYSPEHPCPNPVTPFDKDAARKLLKEAGWKVNPATGILEKDGKRFVFRFLTRDASSEKFLAIFREDLKDVGVEMIIDQKDWAAWMKDMDNFNYDMTWAAWGASIFKDPEGMWASWEADRVSGNNITGFKNPEVDKLINRQKTIFDVTARHEICRKIDAILFEDYPYVLLWNLDYVRLLYWNKFGTPATVLSKYGREDDSGAYWWMDYDSLADLEDAMKDGSPLPERPEAVHFFKVFDEKKVQPLH